MARARAASSPMTGAGRGSARRGMDPTLCPFSRSLTTPGFGEESTRCESHVRGVAGDDPSIPHPVQGRTYGTQRREAITGSVSTIDGNAANVGVVDNVNNMV